MLVTCSVPPDAVSGSEDEAFVDDAATTEGPAAARRHQPNLWSGKTAKQSVTKLQMRSVFCVFECYN